MLRRLINLAFICVCACVASACSQSPNVAQGYIEGEYTYIATSVSGIMRELLVVRGSRVQQGQRLFVLEAQPESDTYQASLEDLKQAMAARDATASNLVFTKMTYERYKILVPKRAIDQSQLDQARSNYNAQVAQLAQAEANIASANAKLAEAKWNVQQKVITAPVEGIIFDRYYRVGEYTEANTPILSLLAPANIKAIFYITGPELGQIKLNDKVTIRCDDCAHTYTGYISFISPSAEYTPPVIYSTETNAKLIYRIEAKFSPKDAYQLHPGQPVNVTYPIHD